MCSLYADQVLSYFTKPVDLLRAHLKIHKKNNETNAVLPVLGAPHITSNRLSELSQGSQQILSDEILPPKGFVSTAL